MLRNLTGLIAALALGSMSQAALAADMAAPEPAPYVSWTGFYLGAGGGVGWTDLELNSHKCRPFVWEGEGEAPLALSGSGHCADYEEWDEFHERWSFNEDGESHIVGIVQGGFDYEIAPSFVVGVMADWQFGDDNGFDHKRYFENDFHYGRWDASHDSIVTVAGRAGFVPMPSLLLYGLVGWSWANIDHNFRISCDECDGTLLHVGDEFDADGLTFGGGAEYKITDNLSIRGEYRFTDFDDFSDNGWDDDEEWFAHSDIDIDVQRVLFTLNWRFGGFGTTAAAAAY